MAEVHATNQWAEGDRLGNHLADVLPEEYIVVTDAEIGDSILDAVVVAPGGVGTLLELLYTWQLLQVHMIQDIPIILLGKMWQDLVQWIKKWPLQNGFLKQEDVDLLTVVDTYEEALEIINEVYHCTSKSAH